MCCCEQLISMFSQIMFMFDFAQENNERIFIFKEIPPKYNNAYYEISLVPQQTSIILLFLLPSSFERAFYTMHVGNIDVPYVHICVLVCARQSFSPQ